MAVIAVGDFDATSVETQIKEGIEMRVVAWGCSAQALAGAFRDSARGSLVQLELCWG